MCDLILSNILGFVVGFASSAVVSWIFYRAGTHDAKRQYLASQIDTVMLALARYDHTQRGAGRRGDDGMEPTAHWILCMVDVLRRCGSIREAESLERVGKEIRGAIADFDLHSDDDRKKQKEFWQSSVAALTGK
jgi:hypothetical protein